MTAVDYTANDGRRWRVMCPDHDLEHPERGIMIGPPDISGLGLPFDIMVRLHNQLHARELFTLADYNRRTLDAIGALQAALILDVERIRVEYMKQTDVQPQPVVAPGGTLDETPGGLPYNDVVVSTSQGARVARRQPNANQPNQTGQNQNVTGQEL